MYVSEHGFRFGGPKTERQKRLWRYFDPEAPCPCPASAPAPAPAPGLFCGLSSTSTQLPLTMPTKPLNIHLLLIVCLRV